MIGSESPAFQLSGGASFRDLRAQGSGGPNILATGFVLTQSADPLTSYTFTDVIGLGDNGGPGQDPFPALTVGNADPTKSISLTISGGAMQGGAAGEHAVVIDSRVAATIDQTTLRGPGAGAGLRARGGASGRPSVTVTDSVLEGAQGAELSDTLATFVRSELRARGTALARSGLVVTDLDDSHPSAVVVEDSLITADPLDEQPLTPRRNAVRAASATSGAQVQLTLRGSTIHSGDGGDPDGGVAAIRPIGAPFANVVLQNTAVRLAGPPEAEEADLIAEGGSITAHHAAFTSALAVDGGAVAVPGSAANVAGDPLFADPAAGLFTLLATSPLIDRGDPALSAPGDLDLAGNPRAVDYDGDGVAQPDIGAYELPAPVTGPPPPGAGPDTDPPKTTIERAPKSRTRKRKAKFRFSADEPGSSFECRLRGKKAKKRLKPFRPCNSPKTYKRLKRARHTFLVRATDAAGNVEPDPAKWRWRVKRP